MLFPFPCIPARRGEGSKKVSARYEKHDSENEESEHGMTNETKHEATQEEKKILPFKTLNGLALKNAAPDKIPALVDGLLLQVGTSMLVAKPKTGKSSLAMQLAVSVAEGRDFLGKQVDYPGDVLYLMLEGPLGVVQQNLKKLGYTEKHGTVSVVHEQMPYRGTEGLERLEATIKSLPKLRLVIVDPAPKLLRLIDSFDPGEVGVAIEKLEQIAKNHKLHLMFLVHAKKKETDDAGDAAMGSTSFRGGTDSNFFMVKTGTQRILSTEQRWGVALEPTLLSFDAETNSMRLDITVEAEEEARQAGKDRNTVKRIEQELWDALSAEENPTQGELLKAVTGKNLTKLRVLEQMVSSGRIVAERDGPAKRYRVVEIQNEVKEAA